MNEVKLSPEKEFSICIFSQQIKTLSQSEAQEMLLLLYRQMLAQEAFYQDFLAKAWGIDSPPTGDDHV